MIWADGARYEGHYKINLRHGLGRLIHADGDFYEGYWLAGRAHGFGTFIPNQK